MNNNIVQIFLIGTIDILERHGIYYETYPCDCQQR